MNKNELINAIAENVEKTNPNVTKKLIGEIVGETLQTIGDALAKDDCVQIIGFGTFMVRKTAARTARNPRTGEEIKIKAGKKITFKVGKALKDRMT